MDRTYSRALPKLLEMEPMRDHQCDICVGGGDQSSNDLLLACEAERSALELTQGDIVFPELERVTDRLQVLILLAVVPA